MTVAAAVAAVVHQAAVMITVVMIVLVCQPYVRLIWIMVNYRVPVAAAVTLIRLDILV